jgi:serine/threonine protein kinase
MTAMDPKPKIDGRFELLQKLGEGGMGEVWKAYEKSSGSVVAVKFLKKELSRAKDVTRFLREIDHLGRILHPNVIRIRECSVNDLWYSMEYCPDGALSQIAGIGERNAMFSAKYTLQVAKGVKALHSAEPAILHRDIKPANILMGADGNLKIADLGLSIAADETHVTTSNWRTPGFAPPEQDYDFAGLEASGDIYSVGAVAYFLLTGNDQRRPPDLSPSNVTDAFSLLLPHMLAKNRSSRLVNINPAIDVLDAIANPGCSSYTLTVLQCEQCGGAAIHFDQSGIDNGIEWNITCGFCGFRKWNL